MFVTYEDLIDHVSGYLGKGVSADAAGKVRRACQAAIRELPTYHDWTYYSTLGRVVTTAPQTAGTIGYVESTRTVTLTGATWPSWTVYGLLKIANVFYEFESVTSSTVAVLKASGTPGENLSGVSYTLLRDTYPVEADLISVGVMALAGLTITLAYTTHQELVVKRRLNNGPSQPRDFAILPGQLLDGRMAVQLWPPPDARYQIDYTYRRRPRGVVIESHRDGLATTAADSATVTGTGTAFSQRHVGSILRVAADAKEYPTGLSGLNPYTAERRVLSVESPTSLTVEGAITETLTRVRFSLSDPVDLEPGAMETALYKLAEKQARAFSRMEPTKEEPSEFGRAMAAAREADSRYFGPRGAGRDLRLPRRLAEMPATLDQ